MNKIQKIKKKIMLEEAFQLSRQAIITYTIKSKRAEFTQQELEIYLAETICDIHDILKDVMMEDC